MVITETVETKWNSKTKKYYQDLGYTFTKMGDTFVSKVEHLKPSSKVRIEIECDVCKKRYFKAYSDYTKNSKSHSHIDVCQKGHCRNEKAKLTNVGRYGVEQVMSSSEIQMKSKQGSVEKYGYENPSYSPVIIDRIRDAFQEKYGVDNVFQDEDTKKQIKATLMESYGVEHPSHSRWVVEKTKRTNMRRHGVTSVLKLYHKSGADHHNWKGGITEENHKFRSSHQYRVWRENVLNNCKATCQKCGTVEGEMNAHHVYDWKHYPELRFDSDNGLIMCKTCHIEFHKEFKAPHDATQLDSFLLNTKND